MSKTYQFVRSRQEAVDSFKALFSQLPVEWLEKKTLNSGYGEKLKGKYQGNDFSAVIYFNKNNYSSKIVLEKGSQQLERLLAEKLGQAAILSSGTCKNQQSQGPLISEAHIGTDESGKGDYFGPLVVAGVYVAPNDVPLLREIGVADSKTISDAKIKVIAAKLRMLSQIKFNLVIINPEKYNELYVKMANLNWRGGMPGSWRISCK